MGIKKCKNKRIGFIMSWKQKENNYFKTWFKTPSLDKMFEDLLKMQELKADIPKLAVSIKPYRCCKPLEVTAIIERKYNETPIITISMGDKGIISVMRVLSLFDLHLK